ncbi:MAG: universal stress protein [Myxococcales bacterium]|nr:universal stress protein [Myxococcales bacterium]
MDVNFDVRKILIPVDFSDASRKAFYVGIKMATIFDSDIHVLHVQEPLTTFESDYDEVQKTASDLERLEQGVQRRVDELFERGGLQAVDRRRVRVDFRGGKPWQEIVRFADEQNIDLIVMATHGYSGVKHMLIGSTAERVVRKATCAVLCVKPDDVE